MLATTKSRLKDGFFMGDRLEEKAALVTQIKAESTKRYAQLVCLIAVLLFLKISHI